MSGAADNLPIDPDLPPDDDVAGSERSRPGRGANLAIVAGVGVGGVIGALGRYSLSLALPTVSGRFPWGTFIINLTGSAVLGFLLVLVIEQFPRGRLARPVLGTGIIGAYTTFSTFTVETVLLVRDGYLPTAVAYFVGSVAAGLLTAWLGMTAARLAIGAERWIQQELS